MSKIMITGALGNVGGYIAKHLINKGEEIVVADINIEALREKFGDTVRSVYFDFTKDETYRDALKEVDRVFIMRPPHLGKPEDLKPFIEELKRKGDIKLVSFLSLIGVEKNPVPPHHRIEKYIVEAGLPYCHIRPSFFMQNISGVHAFEIKHFSKIIVPVGNALTSFIDAEDIGEITAKILSDYGKHINKAYEITGPEAIDYYEVAKIMTKELGRDIIYNNIKPRLALKYWINIRGLEKEYSKVMNMLYMMTRLGGAKKVTNTFEEVMGKKPQSYREFVKKNIEAWL